MKLELNASAALLLATAACTTSPEPLALDAADASVADATPDAGPPDLGFPDTGEPPPPDAGRVDRSLTTITPIGNGPADNLILSPTLDIFASVGPQPTSGAIRRLVLARSPNDGPALRLEPNAGVIMFTQTHGARLSAEVWLGTRDEDVFQAAAGVLGVVNAGLEQLFPLEPDIESTQTIEGIQWTRFSGTLEEPLFGIGVMTVQNETTSSLFVNGPVVTPITAGVTGGRGSVTTRPSVTGRPVKAAWQNVLRDAADRARRHMDENLRAPPSFKERLMPQKFVTPPNRTSR